MYPILTFGSEPQKERWLPRLQSGEAVGCFGLTEPDFGSNPAGMRARARREGSEWVLDGEKTWITNGTAADVAVVWARTEEGIRGFLVEKGTPGYSTSEIHGKWSMRASVTSSLSFSGCRIPAENALPGARGLRSALMCLTQARYGIGWGALGAAMECYETARRYALVRKQFDGRPVASHQLVQEKLVWMITEISKGQLLALRPDGVAYVEGQPSLQARLDYVRERLRLLYVGITRAKRELIVTWNTGKREQEPKEPALAFTVLRTYWEKREASSPRGSAVLSRPEDGSAKAAGGSDAT
jgi:alkylation response protein AidB-like acyl-CoA dehydrogenase